MTTATETDFTPIRNETNPSPSESAAVLTSLTAAEKERFQRVFAKDCQTKLAAYATWRQEHSLDKGTALPSVDVSTDEDIWNWAVRKAFDHHTQNDLLPCTTNGVNVKTTAVADEDETTPSTDVSFEIPQFVYCHRHGPGNQPMRDKQGHLLLQVFGGRLDPKGTPKAHDLYTTSVALYLDRYLSFRKSSTTPYRITLLLDVRAGDGWENPPALEMVGLVRHLATQLHDLYPDRLHKCFLFPVPRPGIWIWNMCKGFLDKGIRSTVYLLPGGALSHSPAPIRELAVYVDEQVLRHCEKVRLSTFETQQT